MENIKHKSEDVAKKEFTPKETACSSGSKEYNTFIDTIVSVVEKYGAEILEEMKLPGLTPGVSFHPNNSIVRPKSSFPCISMYFRICSSFIPTVDTKYPSDQIPSLP